MSDDRLDVLIVEDNPGDAYLIKEMLQDLRLSINIRVAKDGQAALNILEEGQSGTPGLMILDLNLPKVNGFEVLRFMKSSPGLKAIPVIVMTGSLRREDEQMSRELGAVDYCIKPSTAEEIERTTMCLRVNLEPLSTQKGRKDLGPSVKMDLYDPHADERGWRIPASFPDRSLMDAFETGPLVPWR